MPRKKLPPLSFVEQMQKIQAAQLKINEQPPVASPNSSLQEIGSLQERVAKILGIVNQPKKEANRMLFFVMYDIESNKVRTLVHKYLKRMGCTPVQRSIFLANAPIETYNRIKDDLATVQECYENDDSIMIVPLSTDYLKMMKVIGHKIELDVITHSKNTLFF
jgi:CRISPR-associated endonuclease Cas2